MIYTYIMSKYIDTYYIDAKSCDLMAYSVPICACTPYDPRGLKPLSHPSNSQRTYIHFFMSIFTHSVY